MSKQKYLVKTGLSWYGGNRAEAGEVRDDIPPKSIPWLLKGGDIEEYDPKAKVATVGEAGPETFTPSAAGAILPAKGES